MASPQPIDKNFNASYARRGLQPSIGSIEPTRNARVEYRTDPTLRRGGIDKAQLQLAQPSIDTRPLKRDFAANDPRYNDNQTASKKENRRSKKSFLKPSRREDSNSLIEQILEEIQNDSQTAKYTRQVAEKLESLRDIDFDELSFEELLQQLPSGAQEALKRRGIIGKILLLLAYRKAFRRNVWIWSWAFPSWIAFQIPFALLSIAMMMLAVAIAEFVNAFTPTPSKDDGYIVSFGKTVIDAVFTTLAAVAKFINNEVIGLFGIDLTVLDPTTFFILTYVVVFAFGLLVLMAIYFIYALSFLHPLSGKGAGMKMGFLLLALVGYSIPVLNLLPWFLPWTLAVLRYPK